MAMKVLRNSRVSLFVLATCAVLFFTGTVLSQAKKPITRQGLVNAVKSHASAPGLIEEIKVRGVDFQMTAEIESGLRAAGATDQIIAITRDNYRAPRPKRQRPMMP